MLADISPLCRSATSLPEGETNAFFSARKSRASLLAEMRGFYYTKDLSYLIMSVPIKPLRASGTVTEPSAFW